MSSAAITVKNLQKSYGRKSVLKGLNFEVSSGSIFALLGENGAGKTTAVRILSTLIQADSGTASILGSDVSKDAKAIRSKISLTGQYAAVDELLTGEENLFMMGRLLHLERQVIKARTVELLQQFDLTSAAKKPVNTYSGGMRRKLDIAISLLASPAVIFLDEPTTGLDPRSRNNMWGLIKTLANDGVTIFLTTQYLEEADQLADKIAVIANGHIVAEGTAEQLKAIVGEEMIEISFHSEADWNKANSLLNGQGDINNLTISLHKGQTTEILRITLNTLHEQGITPSAINYRRPTLDDVFMEMTGNHKEGVLQHA